MSFKEYFKNKNKEIDNLQTALDVVGIDPTIGSVADLTNVVISTFRAALADEKDERKKHIINAGISAIAVIPFADIIKILKLRKSNKRQ